MTAPRSLVVDATVPGYYNCTSRCVRGAHLCGGDYEHRRAWLLDRMIELDGIFAVEMCAFAIMHNHMHTMVYTDPRRAERWSAREVVERWIRACPSALPDDIEREDAISMLMMQEKLVETWRFRLSSLSWYQKLLKEPIARRANLEDGCTGAFWEGRFFCQRILDDAGIVVVAAYIDLNVVRAGLAKSLEDSEYTSIRDRIICRQGFEFLKRARERGMSYDDAILAWRRSQTKKKKKRGKRKSRNPEPRCEPARDQSDAESGLWLKPINGMRDAQNGTRRSGMLGMTLDQYLSLVDALGRGAKDGKRGVIPPDVRPILERLSIDVETMVTTLSRKTDRIFGTAVGTARSLIAEATRRGQRRVRSSLGLE